MGTKFLKCANLGETGHNEERKKDNSNITLKKARHAHKNGNLKIWIKMSTDPKLKFPCISA